MYELFGNMAGSPGGECIVAAILLVRDSSGLCECARGDHTVFTSLFV